MFSSLSNTLRANRTFVLVLVLIMVSVGGYFWWRAGFTLDFSRFFAAEPPAFVIDTGVGPYKHGDVATFSWSATNAVTCSSDWFDTEGKNQGTASTNPINACAALEANQAVLTCTYVNTDTGVSRISFYVDTNSCPTNATPTPSAEVTPGGGAITDPYHPDCPVSAFRWDNGNGVTGCEISNTFNQDTCTIDTDGRTLTRTIGIVNRSTSGIYARTALFYCPFSTCGAIDHTGPGCAIVGTSGIRSGASSVAPGELGVVTYTFTPGADCGTYQLDDTWGPNENAFDIGGRVINTGSDCPTTTPTISTPPSTSTPPAALQCSSTLTQANIGQAVPFTATGGTGTYAWYAPGGQPLTASGPSTNETYATPGFKTVTVTSGGNQATCTVTIIPPTTSPSSGPFACQPANQSVASGQQASFTASGGSQACGQSNTYAWSAPGGTPTSGQGCQFSSVFVNTTQPTQTFTATVSDASQNQSASCLVTVACPVPSCATPPAGCTYLGGTQCSCGTLVCQSDAPLACAPAQQTVNIGQAASFVAGGGVAPYSWYTASGTPANGAGTNFSASYAAPGSYLATVTAGQQTASCAVNVQGVPTTTITVPPTTPALNIQKTVRNITTGNTEADVTTAEPGQTVEFIIRVSSVGSSTATQVTARDTLPAGLTYQGGTTTIDTVAAADGIVGSGLLLGDMAPGRTIVVRFRVVLAAASYFGTGSTSLVNMAFARATNTPEVSDPAFITLVNGQNTSMSLTKLGRNVTRGETAEHSPVYSSPEQTIEFTIRIRNTSQSTITGTLVRDVLPQGVTFIPGTVRVDGQLFAGGDALVASGISPGSLAPGQERVIIFQGRVVSGSALPVGTTTLINTAQASADGIPMMIAQLPIIITNTTTIPQVPTGPGESTLLALIVSAIITLLYVGYTSTESFRRREAQGIADKARDDHELFDFKR